MNEYHHLLIMEQLGGDERFVDTEFFAQHTTTYWLTCLIYLSLVWLTISEQIEKYAYHTYDIV